jgi:aminotransferase in exopolysaccharide biosynthesis
VDKAFENIIKFIRELYNQPEGFIPLHAPVFNGNEKRYLDECIDTTFVSSVGKFVDKFEEEIAKFTGATKAVSCVNGTNALHLALMLVGVERDTEVITQPLTFIATANAISYCGAKPVFLDVDMDTMGLSPYSLKKWLEENVWLGKSTKLPTNRITGKRITACVPMHTFGHPCRIDEIVDICNEFNIPVVEDAAESLGSYYKGKHTGTFGKVGVVSFNGNKILTTGGGGMLLFNDVELATRAKHLTTQAKVPHLWEFNHDAIGYNYRMPNINAALGLAQLEQLKEFLKQKRQIAEKYSKFFANSNQEISFFSEPTGSKANYWLNAILLKSRNERNLFLEYSNSKGVMTRPTWTLMNKLPMFKDSVQDNLVNALNIEGRLVNIPSSVILTNNV